VTAVTRLGWVAKGAVYVLMGLTAWTIARQQPTEDDASPEGALARVVASPSGRLFAGVLALGLVLYAAWRLLSSALVRGTDLSAWLHRLGYLLSSAFYLILALTAGRAALVNDRPADHTVVERLSADLLGSGFGRVALGVLVIIGVVIRDLTQSVALGWIGGAIIVFVIGLVLALTQPSLRRRIVADRDGVQIFGGRKPLALAAKHVIAIETCEVRSRFNSTTDRISSYGVRAVMEDGQTVDLARAQIEPREPRDVQHRLPVDRHPASILSTDRVT